MHNLVKLKLFHTHLSIREQLLLLIK